MKLLKNHNVNNPFESLKYPNFRYYWMGMCISLIGTWMQNIAQPWLAYSLTKSPLLLSLVGTLQFTPVMFFSLFAGAVLDRFPKKKVLIATQSSFLVITLILSILVLTGQIRYWHILVLAVLMGIVNTLDMPARQAFVIHLVEKESLMNAISLNSMAFNIARVIGPTVAGVVMGLMGVGTCFLINALSYGAVLLGLFFVKSSEVIQERSEKQETAVFQEIREGLRYIRNNPRTLRALTIVGIIGTFALNNSVLVPVFTKQVLGQGEAYFGMIMSLMGVGSLMGAVVTASRSKRGPKEKTLWGFPFIIGIILMIAGTTGYFITLGLTLALSGFFFLIFSSNVNTTIQMDLDNQFRGRVMSVYTLVFAGSTPVGNLFAGIITNRFGPRAGFAGCGAMIVLLMGILLLNERSKIKNGAT